LVRAVGRVRRVLRRWWSCRVLSCGDGARGSAAAVRHLSPLPWRATLPGLSGLVTRELAENPDLAAAHRRQCPQAPVSVRPDQPGRNPVARGTNPAVDLVHRDFGRPAPASRGSAMRPMSGQMRAGAAWPVSETGARGVGWGPQPRPVAHGCARSSCLIGARSSGCGDQPPIRPLASAAATYPTEPSTSYMAQRPSPIPESATWPPDSRPIHSPRGARPR
jgi:hypothetical protein